MGAVFSSARVLSRIAEGPYEVGCADLMTADSTGDPGVFIRIYYPTDEKGTEDSDRPVWLSRPEYAHGLGEYLNQSPQRMNLISSWIVGEKRSNCLVNAPLAAETSTANDTSGEAEPHPRGKLPLIVFSHGLGGCRSFYSVYCTSMASHGYVVAALEHRDLSACWTYELVDQNGTVTEKPHKIRLIGKNEKNEFKIRNQQVNKRVSECVKALNLLEHLNLSGTVPDNTVINKDFNWQQFKNRVDMSTAVIAGHSFGGATALGSTAYSTDFQAAIVLDGWMFSLDSAQQEQARQPTLFLNVGDWQWEENLTPMRKILPQNDASALFTLKGAVHQAFSDFPFIFPAIFAKRFGVQGEVDPTRCMEAAVNLSLAFLRGGKERVRKTVDAQFSDFITSDIYGREKFKL